MAECHDIFMTVQAGEKSKALKVGTRLLYQDADITMLTMQCLTNVTKVS